MFSTQVGRVQQGILRRWPLERFGSCRRCTTCIKPLQPRNMLPVSISTAAQEFGSRRWVATGTSTSYDNVDGKLRGRSHSQSSNQLNSNSGDPSGSLLTHRHFGSLYHPTKALHIAHTIDLGQVMNMLTPPPSEDALSNDNEVSVDTVAAVPMEMKLFGKNSLVVKLPSNRCGRNTPSSFTGRLGDSTLRLEVTRYMAVFRFGTVVFLNVSPRDIVYWVDQIKHECSTEPVASGLERKESFGVMVSREAATPTTNSSHQQRHRQLRPVASLQRTPQGGFGNNPRAPSSPLRAQQSPYYGDDDTASNDGVVVTGEYCIVPDLDLNGVAVISNILAQTVALDWYNDQVDDMLHQFESLNTTVKKSGALPTTEKPFLFKTVAANNAIFIDMIRKIRLKDRSETAWTITKYESIHYALKAEFELEDRFDQIDFKLNLIQQNAKFFLEVLQSQKSNSLEWIIVVLIALECVIMCVDMSGMGQGFFDRLGLGSLSSTSSSPSVLADTSSTTAAAANASTTTLSTTAASK